MRDFSLNSLFVLAVTTDWEIVPHNKSHALQVLVALGTPETLVVPLLTDGGQELPC